MDMSKSGLREVFDENGKFVWNVFEYNGHTYSAFDDELVGRLDGFRKSFPVYDNDICLLTYPKSGTHWVWEILMMLTHGTADHRHEHKHAMMLELAFDSADQQRESRRIINTHLLYDDTPSAILNNTCGKIIQVHRNPADVAVSFYHHLRKEVKGSALAYEWDDFISKLYCDKQRMAHSTWFDYTCEWWSHCSKKPNYLPVFYEELKEDPLKTIRDIAKFIEVEVESDLLQKIVEQTAFQKMKMAKQQWESVAMEEFFQDGYSMYRKGIVGDWKNHFTKEQHLKLMTHFNQQLQQFPELHQRFIKYLQM